MTISEKLFDTAQRAIPQRRIAFCTTVKNRTQHLKLSLPKNLSDNATYANAVFIVLDYASQDDLREYLLSEHEPDIHSGRLVVYHCPDAGPFRMAHAKNAAHRCGIREGGEILVNLDADNYTGPGFSEWLNENITPDAFAGIGKMTAGVTPRGVTGRIATHRFQFLNAGGYDEKYSEWGPDDKCYDWRLRRMGYERLTMPDRFMDCIRHNDKMRFREYPHLRNKQHSGEELIKTENNTVVNFGNVGCGIVYRNYLPEWTALDSIPTRIFGIGLHKTGTTSLHSALKTLGVHSAHWPSAHWAKSVWTEMQDGRSATLEKHYAATDLPIALLYKELDRAYPGSKFILTTRNEHDWLTSVYHHWMPETNQFRHQWDNDPFTHKVHTLLYGRRKFDADVFLRRYRAHNAEVMKYFEDRPDDLLVLPLEDENPWGKLCGFLTARMPKEEYPRANARC